MLEDKSMFRGLSMSIYLIRGHVLSSQVLHMLLEKLEWEFTIPGLTPCSESIITNKGAFVNNVWDDYV